MTFDENKRQEYFRRIRRLKRILRPLPRRTNLHRYPVLKWFANTARKRSALWSFRKEQVVPAIYIGSILALLPPPTPQMPLTFLLALIMRCNLMVAAALTFITNPLTIAPLYYADYKIGGFILDTFWHPSLMEEVTPEVVEMIAGKSDQEVEIVMTWTQKILAGWTQTAVGGLVLGLIFALVIHLCYVLIVRYYNKRSDSHPFGLLGRFKRHYKEKAEADAADNSADSDDAKDAADSDDADSDSADNSTDIDAATDSGPDTTEDSGTDEGTDNSGSNDTASARNPSGGNDTASAQKPSGGNDTDTAGAAETSPSESYPGSPNTSAPTPPSGFPSDTRSKPPQGQSPQADAPSSPPKSPSP